jgi:NTP pyrophosphatase (non-canonical NTP hydrolase)
MNLKKILKFITEEDKRQRVYYPSKSIDTEVFARAVKLIEETGEFFDHILKKYSLQRKQKDSKYENKELSEEFADVVLTSFLLAEAMDINIIESLEKKVEKIEGRYNS